MILFQLTCINHTASPTFWKNPLPQTAGWKQRSDKMGTRLAIQSHRHDKALGRPKKYGDKEDF
jgi:hypothetical protein